MRFEIQKDAERGRWCVVDSQVTNSCVSTHGMKSAAILAKYEYEQMWNEYVMNKRIAA